MSATLQEAIATGIVVLDGGLSTHLEAMGHDLSGGLWSARLIREDPDSIVTAHRDFFAAGAQVATSSTYQASFEGFAHQGIGFDDAASLMHRSVQLADAARAGAGAGRWVAASVGPYGAMLADGSEYRGDYSVSVDALRRWHRERLAVLSQAGADVLACETIPNAAEVEAVIAEVAGCGVPSWISVSGVVRDGVPQTPAGEPLAQVFRLAADVDEVIAVGVNCCDPRDVATMVAAATDASGKPGVVYPNQGEAWDETSRRWVGLRRFQPDLLRSWVQAGARLIGGCCRVEPEAIAAIRAELDGPAHGTP